MPEHHSGGERQQILRFDGVRSRLGDSEPLGRPPHQRRIPHGVGGRHEQQAPRIGGKARQPSRIALLDAGGQGHRGRQAKPTRELRRGQPSRQLQQSERVATCLGNDPLQHRFIQPSRQDRLQQRSRITTAQGRNLDLRQTGERVARLSSSEHERDLLRKETAGREPKHLRRSAIQPLRVIDDTYEWLLLGSLGQEAEDRQSDQEPIRRGPRTESESDAKRVVLGLREALHKLEERGTQLLNRREWELHLRLDPEGPGDPKVPSHLDRVLEQRGLANPRLSTHHQNPAVPAGGGLQQPLEGLALTLPTE